MNHFRYFLTKGTKNASIAMRYDDEKKETKYFSYTCTSTTGGSDISVHNIMKDFKILLINVWLYHYFSGIFYQPVQVTNAFCVLSNNRFSYNQPYSIMRNIVRQQSTTIIFDQMNTNENYEDETISQSNLISTINPDVARKFTIRICTSTSCTTKRRKLNMNENTTYNEFNNRIQQINSPLQYVQIQQKSLCLGSCQKSPCVALEHDDYDGPVSVLGMNNDEFTKSVFNTIIDSNDISRVLTCLENAIIQMSQEEDE
jgi:NADH:ubiquinone oxidoreductase subunit E